MYLVLACFVLLCVRACFCCVLADIVVCVLRVCVVRCVRVSCCVVVCCCVFVVCLCRCVFLFGSSVLCV